MGANMSHQWTDLLSAYIDGELDEPTRLALEAHLEACAECRETLRELEQVVWRARTLQDRPPETDLWPAIAERIRAAGEQRDESSAEGMAGQRGRAGSRSRSRSWWPPGSRSPSSPAARSGS